MCKNNNWSSAALACVFLTAAWPAFADGLIMSFAADGGAFGRSQSRDAFAKHYGPGGVPLAVEPEAELPPDQNASLGDVSFPAPRQARADVLTAIHETALRYAGDPVLRSAGMSVTDWVYFFQANVEIESGYNHSAVSRVGAIGLGQLMPDTARNLGVDPRNMRQNLDGSARYLLMLLAEFGTPELALAGYNAGPGAVQQHNGIPPYRETVGHVKKVMAVFNRLKGESV